MGLTVYVPRPESDLRRTIWPGSGIVGSEQGDTGRFRVDFEGDRDRYPAYKDRVRRAAERHSWFDGERAGYPTRACAYVDEDELIAVGNYALDSDQLVVNDRKALEEWLEAGSR